MTRLLCRQREHDTQDNHKRDERDEKSEVSRDRRVQSEPQYRYPANQQRKRERKGEERAEGGYCNAHERKHCDAAQAERAWTRLLATLSAGLV